MALTAKKVYAILKRQISDMEAKLNSPVRYRGTVATADLLPLNPDIGDMYNIESKSVYGEAGMNVAWNGVVWDTMGAPIDMSLYLTKEEAEAVIQRLVTEYFEKNPVKPGATTEQAQQIEQNKTDIASLKKETGSLKEDISTKITKFYASSQGETHLADSDNGKIQDMMVYGKSEQKQYSGKNLLNATLQTTTQNGVTCTANGDGTYTINGTATSDTLFHIGYFIFEKDTKYKIVGCPQGGSLNTLYRLDGSLNANSDTGNGIVYSGDGNKKNARIVVFNGATVNNLLFKPMITTDLTATYDDFEPYTGGIPSPNPDYPQEIKSVVNPTVKVCGKNLVNVASGTIVGMNYNGGSINVEPGASYTVTLSQTLTKAKTDSESSIFQHWITIYDANKTVLQEKSFSTFDFTSVGQKMEKSETLIMPENAYTVYFDLENYAGSDAQAKLDFFQVEKNSKATAYEPYHEQTVTLPYTLNAIPVNSGGNVTIDGQQYIADYVDVERGKLVKKIKEISKDPIVLVQPTNNPSKKRFILGNKFLKAADNFNKWSCKCSNLQTLGAGMSASYGCVESCGIDTGGNLYVYYEETSEFTTAEEFKAWWGKRDIQLMGILETPIEIDLTSEEIAAFKALVTYYPTTNISVNSEQLDGYTIFNYPISMENGWNYVKQQIGDTRNYIYDMDARAQDTDLQAAEAYVNSEYAVTLTELEV